MPLEIVIATGNPHKVEEIGAIFAAEGLDIRLRGLNDVPGAPFPEPVETGRTFEENATIKAIAYAEATGRLCLADDSGLEVDALDGRPGVISSHYCTDGRETGMTRAQRDEANNARVLRELQGVAPALRGARFRCVMVLAMPGCALPPGRGLSGPDESALKPTSPLPPLATHSTFRGGFQQRHTDLLPHWQAEGASYFLTFRLKHGELNDAERQHVLAACLHWHGSRVRVSAAVVMPDHVHLIATPLKQPDGAYPSVPWLMQSIKGFTSTRINQARVAVGPLWQDEYWDRIIRDDDELLNTRGYIALNPWRAGLVKREAPYPFLVVNPERGLRGSAAEGTGLVVMLARGAFEGRVWSARGLKGPAPQENPAPGKNGFGYDPIFLVAPDFTTTSAELSPEEKNARSHRGEAARRLAAALRGSTCES